MNCPKCGKPVKAHYAGYRFYTAKHCLVRWMIAEREDGSYKFSKMCDARKSDSQRKKVYTAESVMPDGKMIFGSRAQAYVDNIWASPWFRLHYPNHKRGVKVIALRTRRGSTISGASYGGKIAVKSITSEFTLLHELAHEVTEDSHGPQFARALIKFVDRWHSDPTAAATLRVRFRACRVKVARGLQAV